MMKIVRESLLEGAKRAKGLVVIIDVFRACTTAAYVIANGAEKLITVSQVEEAFELKREYPELVLIGERKGRRIGGFDYGNSPYRMSQIDFSGKGVVLTTSAGTQGMVKAERADEILLGNFVCAGSNIRYIQKRRPDLLTLVAMGKSGLENRKEDEYCAEYIEKSLNGDEPKFSKIKESIRNYRSAKKFFDDSKPEFPEGDFHCAMDLDRFDFTMKAVEENGSIDIINVAP